MRGTDPGKESMRRRKMAFARTRTDRETHSAEIVTERGDAVAIMVYAPPPQPMSLLALPLVLSRVLSQHLHLARQRRVGRDSDNF